MFAMIGCNNNGMSKATEKSVLKYLPGTWKVTKVIDEKGNKTDYNGEAVFVFGKQESSSDFSQHNSSYLWGYCTITKNGDKILSNGTWNIEPDEEDKGVVLYFQKGSSFISFEGDDDFMITSIGSSSMRWEDNYNQSGYMLSREK